MKIRLGRCYFKRWKDEKMKTMDENFQVVANLKDEKMKNKDEKTQVVDNSKDEKMKNGKMK